MLYIFVADIQISIIIPFLIHLKSFYYEKSVLPWIMLFVFATFVCCSDEVKLIHS